VTLVAFGACTALIEGRFAEDAAEAPASHGSGPGPGATQGSGGGAAAGSGAAGAGTSVGEGGGGKGGEGGGGAGGGATSAGGSGGGPKPLGAACVLGGDCASGECQDGVCCDGPCAGSCRACAALKTGGQDGTCADVKKNTDPDDECAHSYGCVPGAVCCGEASKPPPGACPASCTGGCGADGVTCTILCDQPAECANLTLVCPAGLACELKCTADDSCLGATLSCPDKHACIIQCGPGKKPCDTAMINCGATGTCALSCGAGNDCLQAKLNCGSNQCSAMCQSTTHPSVVCGPSCDCKPC
jgi:hypothetical protein